MPDDTIPLYDGEPTGAKIIHPFSRSSFNTATNASSGSTSVVLRSKRSSSRKACEDIHVCFCPNDASVRPEYVECPLLNISERGLAIEMDQAIRVGVRGMIAYRTVSRRPVHISCGVRSCRPVGEGRYIVGIRVDRVLDFDERQPAKLVPGREVASGIHARKLRAPIPASTPDDWSV